MTFRLQAPVPNIVTTSVMPNPQFNDTGSRRLSIDVKRSMNGIKRTYVKSSDRILNSYTFMLARRKAEEIKEFCKSYYGAKIRWTDHLGDVWEGYIATIPVDFVESGKAQGWPGHTSVELSLQLEGTRVSTGDRDDC